MLTKGGSSYHPRFEILSQKDVSSTPSSGSATMITTPSTQPTPSPAATSPYITPLTLQSTPCIAPLTQQSIPSPAASSPCIAPLTQQSIPSPTASSPCIAPLTQQSIPSPAACIAPLTLQSTPSPDATIVPTNDTSIFDSSFRFDDCHFVSTSNSQIVAALNFFLENIPSNEPTYSPISSYRANIHDNTPKEYLFLLQQFAENTPIITNNQAFHLSP